MLGNILNIARSAIAAQQAAVQVVSQNISNSQTEGYSRQRANLDAGAPARTPVGMLGSGVVVRDVTRARDALLDTTYRRETGNAADFGLRRELLGQVEEIFGELSDSGFSYTLDAFWSSWSDLANHPTNASVRGLVKQHGEEVVFALNNYAARLDSLRSSVTTRVDRTVEEVNELARQLADINRQVSLAEGGGSTAPDLRDQRDRVLDQISRLAQVQVVERSDRSVAVFIGTISLVDGSQARAVEMDSASLKLRIGTSGLRDVGGSLGAMLDLRDTEIPLVQSRLDELARKLVEEVNAIHVDGTGRSFFDPARTTAGTIALSAEIDDPSVIGTVPGAPADNQVALDLAALRDRGIAFSSSAGKTFGGFYGQLVSDVGLKVNSADRSSTVYETLASQADTRRAGVSGVSTEEELLQLMRHQQAYAAATRLVAAADEMLKAILQLT